MDRKLRVEAQARAKKTIQTSEGFQQLEEAMSKDC